MSTVYTVGYQPVEIISRQYGLVDLQNQILDRGVPSGNLKAEIIEYLKTFTPADDDFMLLNTARNKDLLPYCNALNTVLYDPPYVASEPEVAKLLQALHQILGHQDRLALYAGAVNAVRALLTHSKDNLPQSVYYNALHLLSDVHRGQTEVLEQHLLQYTTPAPMAVRKKIIFYGDPVHPNYIAQLNANGIYISAFIPQEFFVLPCDQPDRYYYENPLFQTHLYMLIELRRLFSIHAPDALVLNPGGLYLTDAEADFFVYKLSSDLPVYRLSGAFTGAPLQL